MKKIYIILFYSALLTGALSADSRPLAEGIEAYSTEYPIEPYIPEMLKSINAASMELNRQGYALYEQRQYKEAILKFGEAVSADENNCFAWYNMACCYSLMDEGYPAQAAQSLVRAVRSSWMQFWGVKLMADPDLDPVRGFDTGGVNHIFGYAMEVDMVLLPDGKALVKPLWGDRKGPVTKGYYCVIDTYVFTFFDIPEWEDVFGLKIHGSFWTEAIPLSKFSFREPSRIYFYEDY
ncbi:MAG: hypothetical protein E4H36_07670 [Spirochaetales bacterium]|nr:MAG: hypothetical protein E4H36_07670 [Spirochaetales bacterium]